MGVNGGNPRADLKPKNAAKKCLDRKLRDVTVKSSETAWGARGRRTSNCGIADKQPAEEICLRGGPRLLKNLAIMGFADLQRIETPFFVVSRVGDRFAVVASWQVRGFISFQHEYSGQGCLEQS
jgi:hypothetical protein